MNLRHAAALALVGWYLVANTSGPPSDWIRIKSFDTAAQCEDELSQARAEASRKDHDITPDNLKYWQMVGNGECIATDDPRLKEK